MAATFQKGWDGAKKESWGEHFAAKDVNWEQVSDIKKFLERQNFSAVKLGKGSPSCKKLHPQITQFQKM